MAELKALMVRGIRSFPPDDQGQVIKFQKPLTLILGANGCGKTTVIECLKYATIGVMPPGSKGSSFVHDPKLAKATVVRAQVKLKFSDSAGRPIVVIRSLCCQQKMAKLECRTVDGTIQRKVDDKVTSLSMKCVDMDEEMTALLGVSKAVLDSVIFCHQEDSNWPLSEPKVLKDKFDELFSATRYSKALDEFRKIRNNFRISNNECKTELKYLGANKDKAEEISKELCSVKEELERSESKAKELSAELQPMKEQLENINQSLEKAADLRRRIDNHNMKYNLHQRTISELLKTLKEPFQGTDKLLMNEIENFENSLEESNLSLHSAKMKVAAIGRDLDKLRSDRDHLIAEKGKLVAKLEFMKSKEKAANCLLSEVAKSLKIRKLSGASMESRLARVSEAVEANVAALNAKKREHEAAMRELQSRACEVQNQLESGSRRLVDISQRVEAKKQCQAKLERQLAESSEAFSRLNDIDETAKEINDKIEQLVNSNAEENLKTEMEALTKTKRECTIELDQLVVEHQDSQEMESVRTELNMMKNDVSQKSEQIAQRLKYNKETIDEYFSGVKIGDLRVALERRMQPMESERSETESKLRNMEMEYHKCTNDRKALNEQIDSLESQLREWKRELKITELKPIQIYDDELNSLAEVLETLQLEKGTLDGKQLLYREYLTAVRKESCCPLCKKKFENHADEDSLYKQIDTDLTLLPARQEELKRSVENTIERRERLMKQRPLLEMARNLESTKIPETVAKRDKVSTRIGKLEESLKELKVEQRKLRNDLERIANIRDDVLLVDALQREVDKLKAKMETHELRLGKHKGLKSSQELYDLMENKRLKLSAIAMKMDRLQANLNSYRGDLQSLRDQLHRITEEKMRIMQCQQNASTLSRQLEEVTAEIDKLHQEAARIQEESVELESEADQVTKRRQNFEIEWNNGWQRKEDETANLSKQLQEAQHMIEYIRTNRLDECEEKLASIEAEVTDLQDKIAELETSREEQNRRCGQLHDSLISAEIRKRELEDNLKMRNEQKLADQTKEEVTRLQQKLNAMGFQSDSGINIEELNSVYCEKLKDYHQLVGQRAILQQSVQRLNAELQSDQYADATKKYNKKLIESVTLQLANEDLMKYSGALDMAIIKRHHMMMEQINDIIKELWTTVYKGNDIDYIEIKSEEFGVQNDKRRSYNYRIVMHCGDTELDMRGRCSAGQKVLASIIVRVALAEVFSFHCGFFALDEPTTNLDSANVESLANALAELIKARAVQKHFQLILITHDESFVEHLCRAWPVDVFYRVTKNHLGFSQLTEESIRHLHGR